MSYLYHVTLGTGHLRRSPRAEVGDAVLRDLAPWLAGALASGAPSPLPVAALSHFAVRATREAGALLVTLLAPRAPHARGRPYRGETIPLITLGVAQRSRQGAELWAMMVAQFDAAPGLAKPAEPWCAVAVHPPVAGYPESLDWLGDFERCAAWAWITRNPDLGAADDPR